MLMLPKLINSFNAMPIQSRWLFIKTDELILKFMWNCRRPRMLKNILKKKNKKKKKKEEQSLRTHCSLFQNLLPGNNDQNSVALPKGWTYKSTEQSWKSRNKPCVSGKLFFNRDVKTIQYGQNSLFINESGTTEKKYKK